MGKALYRTYRSKKLDEIVGQEHITSSLSRALKNGTIAHAYLFTGPRGVGKTSIARILAHEINNLPYEGEPTSLDIIEIDAASNRRIDEIRDLRDKVHSAPTSSKYKVYIIDEVHMLTREAFNALLKTLEEPPAHVIFVLATTEVHKLPETIISRTQRFAFKPVEQAKVVEHLKFIAGQEKIDVDDKALELIAAHGEGSFRDSISLLDQVRNSGKKVSLEAVQSALGIAPAAVIDSILKAIDSHDTLELARNLQAMESQGFEPAQTSKQLAKKVRDELLKGETKLDKDLTLKLLAQLIDVPASHDPKSYLEITLMDAALAGPSDQKTPKPNKTSTMPQKTSKPDAVTEPHPSKISRQLKAGSSQQKAEDKHQTAESGQLSNEPKSNTILGDEDWQKALDIIKQKRSTLHSILKLGETTFSPGKITITATNAFNQKRLNEPNNKNTIASAITGACGKNVDVQCILNSSSTHNKTNKKETEPAGQSNAVDTISNIFGSAEVLE